MFTNSKNLQYVALLNLLDNYLPLVLSIYTITFKRNDFLQYRSAMIRVWVMFVCLERRHYNKSSLVWLSCTTHWENNFPQLYNLWKKWPTIFDEYPVENTHSILQAQTHQSDTAEQLTKKAKIIFGSKEWQMNFRSAFTPPKQFTFSLQQLQFLKTKCAQLLTTIISKIHSHPAPVSKIVKKRTKYVHLPDLFVPVDMKYTVLPVGYHSVTLRIMRNLGSFLKVVVIPFTKSTYKRQLFVHCANNSFPTRFKNWPLWQEMPFYIQKMTILMTSTLITRTMTTTMMIPAMIRQIPALSSQLINVT